MAMRIQENWAVSPARARAFFASQPDVAAAGEDFRYKSCTIRLLDVPVAAHLPFAVPRVLLEITGPEEEVRAIHRRFFLQFLSAGG